MELVKQGGVKVEDSKQEFVYKCPMDGAVLDKPGKCPKCGMMLDDKYKVPKESAATERKIYVCDAHPEKVFDEPGRCKKDT